MSITTPFRYGSSQCEFSAVDTQKLQLAHSVVKNDLEKEHDTHLTVRYGIEDFNPEHIKEQVKDFEPIVLTILDIDCFPDTKDGAAIYFKVETNDELLKLRQTVEDNAQCIAPTFPDYKPHITIGYFNKEKWQEDAAEMKKLYEFPFDIIADNFVISKKNGKQYNFPLHKNYAAHKIAHLIKNQLT